MISATRRLNGRSVDNGESVAWKPRVQTIRAQRRTTAIGDPESPKRRIWTLDSSPVSREILSPVLQSPLQATRGVEKPVSAARRFPGRTPYYIFAKCSVDGGEEVGDG